MIFQFFLISTSPRLTWAGRRRLSVLPYFDPRHGERCNSYYVFQFFLISTRLLFPQKDTYAFSSSLFRLIENHFTYKAENFQFFLISTRFSNKFDLIEVFFQFFLISTLVVYTVTLTRDAFSSSLFRPLFRQGDEIYVSLSVLPYFDPYFQTPLV